MVHDFFHAIVVALDARHGDSTESTMRYGLAEINHAVDRVLVLVDEVVSTGKMSSSSVEAALIWDWNYCPTSAEMRPPVAAGRASVLVAV